MSAAFEFGAPDLFTTGTVGPPGQRVFYLQAREGGILATLKVEKEQVRALAEYLADLLAKLPTAGEAPSGDLTLLEPIVPAWAVGSLAVAYDESLDRIVLVAEELVEEEAEAEEERQAEAAGAERATARFRLTRAQAAAFAERAQALVAAGRPSCRICGQPMDPEGHVCPRSNGHLRGGA